METSKEFLFATQEWDQKSPHRHRDKEIGQELYLKNRFSAIIEDHPKYSRIPHKGVYKDAWKGPAPYSSENLS